MSVTTTGPFFPFGAQPTQPHPDVYANQMRLGLTLMDFTLTFSTTEDVAPGTIGLRDRVTLRLSPSMLKFVSLTIQNALAAYEEGVGAIPFTKEYENLINENQAKLLDALKTHMAQTKSTVGAANPGA